MNKYFNLQMKLAAKQLPFVLLVTLVLLVGVAILFSAAISVFYNDNTTRQYTVGITGDTDNPYMQWGFAALRSIEEEHFSVSLAEMTEAEAQKALESGAISAYVCIPEGFMEKALVGELDPITYVTSAGLEGIATLLKREITQIVTEIVVQSQKGAFGLQEAIQDNGIDQDAYTHMTNLSFQYTDLIFSRGELFAVESLGVSDSLAAQDYYLCALTVILLSLMGIPFATVYIRKDQALSQLLLSRGYPTGRQLFCEFCAHLLSMLTLMVTVLLIGAVLVDRLLVPSNMGMPKVWLIMLRVIPVVVMLSAMNMMLFNCCDNLVSGLLLQFFIAIGLCYISGCIYPIYVFPKGLWPVAAWLPTGLARSHLATAFNRNAALGSFAGLMLYAAAFYGVALWVRVRKTVGSLG